MLGILLSYRGATAGKGQKWSMVAVAGRRSPAISDQADPRRGVMSCVFLTRINALSTLDRPFLSPAQSPATKKLIGGGRTFLGPPVRYQEGPREHHLGAKIYTWTAALPRTKGSIARQHQQQTAAAQCKLRCR